MNTVEPKALKIALLPGDGIGPEVLDAAVMVLHETASACDFDLRFETFSVGATEYLKTGDPMDEFWSEPMNSGANRTRCTV